MSQSQHRPILVPVEPLEGCPTLHHLKVPRHRSVLPANEPFHLIKYVASATSCVHTIIGFFGNAHNRLGGMMWLCGTHRSGGATSVELGLQLGRDRVRRPKWGGELSCSIPRLMRGHRLLVAEGVGFEPTEPLDTIQHVPTLASSVIGFLPD